MGWKRQQADRLKANPVAKHAHKANRSATFTDRKQKAKRGYIKHKGKEL